MLDVVRRYMLSNHHAWVWRRDNYWTTGDLFSTKAKIEDTGFMCPTGIEDRHSCWFFLCVLKTMTWSRQMLFRLSSKSYAFFLLLLLPFICAVYVQPPREHIRLEQLPHIWETAMAGTNVNELKNNLRSYNLNNIVTNGWSHCYVDSFHYKHTVCIWSWYDFIHRLKTIESLKTFTTVKQPQGR